MLLLSLRWLFIKRHGSLPAIARRKQPQRQLGRVRVKVPVSRGFDGVEPQWRGLKWLF